VIAAAGALVLAVAILSLSWPRYHDGALMEYLAWSIRHGNRPYVDLFDMQFPGTYVFFCVGQYIFGTGDVSFRVRDLIVLTAGCYGMYRLLRPFGREASSVAVILLATRYLVYGGAEQSLQRDWLVALLVIGAVALLMDDTARRWKLVTAGVFFGYACTIKPHAVVFLALAPIILWLADRGRSPTEAPRTSSALRQCVLVFAGAIAIIGAIIGWLVVSGSWSAFVWMATKYLPLYTHLDSGGHELGSTADALRSSFTLARGRPEVPLLGFGALVLLLRHRPAEQVARLAALTLVLLAGFAYAVLEIKNWPYHFWPFVLANVALVAVAISDVRARRWSSWKRPIATWASKICSFAFLVCFCREVGFTARAVSNQVSANQHVYFRDLLPRLWLVAIFLPLVLLAVADLAHASVFSEFYKVESAGVPGLAWSAAVVVTVAVPLLIGSISAVSITVDRDGSAEFSSPYVAGITNRNEYVGELLQARAQPGDRVQILDTTGGAADIALRAGLQPASRFVEDFHFYHDVNSGVNAKLRRELMADLLRNQPRFILFFRRSWYVRMNYDDVARFPELARYLTRYRIIFEDGDMRVLEHAKQNAQPQ
jgi:hypothetical protein